MHGARCAYGQRRSDLDHEYLETAYRPDREYLDGAVMERNMGKWSHAQVQAYLSGWFLRE